MRCAVANTTLNALARRLGMHSALEGGTLDAIADLLEVEALTLRQALAGGVELEVLLSWAEHQRLPLVLDTATGTCEVTRRYEVVVDGVVFAACDDPRDLVGAPQGALVVEHRGAGGVVADTSKWGAIPCTPQSRETLRRRHLDAAAHLVRTTAALFVGTELEERAFKDLLPLAEALGAEGEPAEATRPGRGGSRPPG
jgi:hypothetical protein